MNDHYTKRGAHELAGRIKAFWAGQGKSPHVWAEPIYMTRTRTRDGEQVETTETLWCVKSNMVGGRPV